MNTILLYHREKEGSFMAYVKFILWAKSMPNGKCLVCCKGGLLYWCKMSLRNIIRANIGYGLLKIHQSRMVNINFISKRHVFCCTEIRMIDNTTLFVCRALSRAYEKSGKKRFTEM